MSASHGPRQHAQTHAGVSSRAQYPPPSEPSHLQHDQHQHQQQHQHQHQQHQHQQHQQQHYGYNQPGFHAANSFMPPGVARYSNTIGSASFAIPNAEATASSSAAHLQQHPPSLAQSGSASSNGSLPDQRGASTEKHSQGYANWKSASPMTPATAATATAAPAGQDPSDSSPWMTESAMGRSGKRNRRENEMATKVDAPDDDVKRARGRPRLQTTDQTPSERRRTQIRLAQRAYRSRKETAMNDLEGQVKKLKNANIEMQDAFQRLSSIAQQYDGILSQVPELVRQMQRIKELAERRKESTRSESPAGSDDGLEQAQHDPTEAAIKTEDSKNSDSPIQKLEGQTQHLLGGIVVNYEPADHQSHQMQAHDYNGFSGQGASEYEVIAVPTAENASFAPNKINLEAVFMQGMSWPTQPQLQTMQATHMGSTQASAFAKTLYRHARERTATLVNVDNPPVERILRVFGFSTVFETLDDIRRRVNEDLQASRNEMYNMQFPIYQTTGIAGQYASDGSGRIVMSGVKMSNVRGKLLEMSKILQVPGSRSVLWDCDEVDLFFSQRGVVIGDAAGIFSAEVNPAAFWLQDVFTQQASQAAHFDSTGMDSRGHNDLSFDNGQERWNDTSQSGVGGPQPPNPELLSNGERKIVRIDVGKLLDGLSIRTVALGQTLGFRPSDVKAAFWESMVE